MQPTGRFRSCARGLTTRGLPLLAMFEGMPRGDRARAGCSGRVALATTCRSTLPPRASRRGFARAPMLFSLDCASRARQRSLPGPGDPRAASTLDRLRDSVGCTGARPWGYGFPPTGTNVDTTRHSNVESTANARIACRRAARARRALRARTGAHGIDGLLVALAAIASVGASRSLVPLLEPKVCARDGLTRQSA